MDKSLRKIRCRQCGCVISSNHIKGSEQIRVDCFLEENKPTYTTNRRWIFAYNPATRKERLDSEELAKIITISQRLTRKDDYIQFIDESGGTQILDLIPENIDQIARNINLTVGKWLIFLPESQIDEVWLKIAKAIIHGPLDSVIMAKVSTTPKEKKYVICFYTANYLDEEEVMKVRERLRDLGIECIIFYKPDIYSHLGIYSGTTSLPAHRYKA